MWIFISKNYLQTKHEKYIYIECEKHFTMLQEIIYKIACEYLYTIYLAYEYIQHKRKRWKVKR